MNIKMHAITLDEKGELHIITLPMYCPEDEKAYVSYQEVKYVIDPVKVYMYKGVPAIILNPFFTGSLGITERSVKEILQEQGWLKK